MSEQDNGMTAREMFDTLLAGKKVGVVATCTNDPELVKLLNHLNVIRCRSRNVYESLGLAWENSTITITPKLSKAIAGDILMIALTIPVPAKKYPSFTIIEDGILEKQLIEKDEHQNNINSQPT